MASTSFGWQLDYIHVMSGIPSGIPFVKPFKNYLIFFKFKYNFKKVSSDQMKSKKNANMYIKIIIFNFFDLWKSINIKDI